MLHMKNTRGASVVQCRSHAVLALLRVDGQMRVLSKVRSGSRVSIACGCIRRNTFACNLLSARTAKSQMWSTLGTGCNQIFLLVDVCMSRQLLGCSAKVLIGSSGGGRLVAVLDHCGREAGACRGARWLSSCAPVFLASLGGVVA